MNLGNFNYCLGFGRLRFELFAAAAGSYGVTKGLAFLAIGDPGFKLHFGGCTANFGGDLQAGAAVIVQIKVGFTDTDDADVAVQTAVERKSAT